MRARAPTAMRYVYARPCYTHDNDCVWVARALLLCTTNLSLQTIEHAITRLFGELSSVISHKKKKRNIRRIVTRVRPFDTILLLPHVYGIHIAQL